QRSRRASLHAAGDVQKDCRASKRAENLGAAACEGRRAHGSGGRGGLGSGIPASRRRADAGKGGGATRRTRETNTERKTGVANGNDAGTAGPVARARQGSA